MINTLKISFAFIMLYFVLIIGITITILEISHIDMEEWIIKSIFIIEVISVYGLCIIKTKNEILLSVKRNMIIHIFRLFFLVIVVYILLYEGFVYQDIAPVLIFQVLVWPIFSFLEREFKENTNDVDYKIFLLSNEALNSFKSTLKDKNYSIEEEYICTFEFKVYNYQKLYCTFYVSLFSKEKNDSLLRYCEKNISNFLGGVNPSNYILETHHNKYLSYHENQIENHPFKVFFYWNRKLYLTWFKFAKIRVFFTDKIAE